MAAPRHAVRLVCLDIDGTLTDGVRGSALTGAVDAVQRIRKRLPVRLVTNTTSVPHRVLAEHLLGLGLLDSSEALVTPATIAKRVLIERGHARGLLFMDPDSREDFEWFRLDENGPAVVLATEGHYLTVADLQPAFRHLLDGAAFYTLQRNRYFRKGGAMVTDIGPLAAFLTYASGREAETMGKPSAVLFDAIASEAGVSRNEVVMVGDDAEFDVAASVTLGMSGILVRTGKFRPEDVTRFSPRPSAVLESVADLPEWLGIA